MTSKQARRISTPLTVVDLFSGSGGMSAGFARLRSSYSIVGAVDREVARPGRGKAKGANTECNSTYEANIGVHPLPVDLASVAPSTLRRTVGVGRRELDVLIACPPCTGFSQKSPANHHSDDPRNSLVGATAAFVAEFKPRFFVLENVRGLVTGPHRHHFRNLLSRLEQLGYGVWHEVMDMSLLGLPQTRNRLLLIASRDGDTPRLHNGRKVRTAPTVRDTIEHLPSIRAGEAHGDDPMHQTPRLTAPVLERIKAVPHDGGSWGDILDNPRLSTKRKKTLLIPCMLNGSRNSFPDVYGRLWWDRPAVTITRECGHVGNGRFAHPEQDRLLSVREMALLQGFPAKYTFSGPLRAKYNQVGDAVPPLVARQIAQAILAVLR